jgi:hypothetical protein
LGQKSNTSNRYGESNRLNYVPYYHLFVNSPFFRPKLKIEHNQREKNTYSPEQEVVSGSRFRQRYMRISLKNTGRRTAHKCEAELTVVIPKQANENELMRYPSDEPKLLAWGRYPQSTELKISMDIPANARRFLQVVFSDSDFGTRAMGPNTPKRYACVSTLDHLRRTDREAHWANNFTVPDSFTSGRFKVEIDITSEDGVYTSARFWIDVDSDWKKLRMERITRGGSLKHFISHAYNRLVNRQTSNPTPVH